MVKSNKIREEQRGEAKKVEGKKRKIWKYWDNK